MSRTQEQKDRILKFPCVRCGAVVGMHCMRASRGKEE